MIFSKIGESLQCIQNEAPAGYVEMLEERPLVGDYVASKQGVWVINRKGLIDNAKETLSLALSANIESGGHIWQVRNSIDLQNIQDAIEEHNYAGLEDDVTQSFRMADNTWQDLTVDKFEKVLSDYRLRKKDIYSSYKAWTSGEMLEAFEV